MRIIIKEIIILITVKMVILCSGCVSNQPNNVVEESHRTVRLDITSTPSERWIVGYTKQGKLSMKRPLVIGLTPIHDTITIPNDIVNITVDTGNPARFDVFPSGAAINDSIDHIEKHFEITDLLPLAQAEFNVLSPDQRVDLIHVIGVFDVALNSPKFLFSMKSSEAQSALSEFNEKYPDLKEMEIGKLLDKLSLTMKLSASMEMDFYASDYVRLLQAVTK